MGLAKHVVTSRYLIAAGFKQADRQLELGKTKAIPDGRGWILSAPVVVPRDAPTKVDELVKSDPFNPNRVSGNDVGATWMIRGIVTIAHLKSACKTIGMSIKLPSENEFNPERPEIVDALKERDRINSEFKAEQEKKAEAKKANAIPKIEKDN